MEPLIIRKAAANLYILLVLSILLFLFFLYIFYEDFTPVAILIFVILSILPALLFRYALRELIKKTPQLTFTEEGLLIRNGNFYAWKNVDDFTFSREEVGSDNAGRIYKNYISLSLKDGTAAKIPISHLDRNAEEIIYLLREHKRISNEASFS